MELLRRVLLFALVALQAFGAIAPDNSTPAIAASSTASSLTFNHAVGAGLSNSILVVFVGYFVGATVSVSGITYNGVALTKILKENDGTHQVAVDAWYLLNPASGTNSVAITMNGAQTGNFLHAIAVSLSGVDQVSPIDNSISSAVASAQATFSQSITVGSANAYALDAISVQLAVGTDTWAPTGTSQTEVNDGGEDSVRGVVFSSYRGPLATGAQTLSWGGTPNTSSFAALLAISLKPATAAGAVLHQLLTLGVGK